MEAAGQSLYTCRSLISHLEQEHAELQDLLDEARGNNASDNTISAIAERAMTYGATVSGLKKREEFLDRRLNHAVKCLQRKKLWAEDSESLMAICEERDMLRERAVLQMISCTMGSKVVSIAGQGELDVNCWKIGIDMAMVECEPELAGTDGLYGPVLETHICRIFADTFMAAYGSKLGQLLESESYTDVILEPLFQKYSRDERFSSLVRSGVKEAVADMISDVLSVPDGPEEKGQADLERELSEARSALADQGKAIEKATAPLHARSEKLARKNADLEAEIAALRSENESLYAALADRDARLSEAAQAMPAGGLPELPEKNVVFAGGHPNMTKKIMQDHPGWVFIGAHDKAFPEFRSPEIIFIWDQHMSHPVWHRIRRLAPPSVPQVFVKSTNLDMLEDEMRRAWAAAAGARQEGGDDA